jgi:3-oxoacyl-[acyl-carrier-protein] synthase I
VSAAAGDLTRLATPLSIVAVGAVTCLGWTVHASCAALRAGIARPRPVRYFRVTDDDELDTKPVLGFALEGFTDGFVGGGRWLRLAGAALRDLVRDPGASALPRDRTALVVVDPVGLPRSASDGSPLAAYVAPLFPAPIDAGVRTSEARGHAGVHAAIAAAGRAISGGDLDRVIVLAADSLLTPDALLRLARDGRLKGPDAPTGIRPGEAAVALLLESTGSARRRGIRTLAEIPAVALAREPRPFAAGEPGTGRGIATAVTRAIRALSSQPFAGDLFLDLTGETWKAHDWGMAQFHLRRTLGPIRLLLPADGVGDVGAAAPAIALCAAIHLHRRGASSGPESIVVSSSDQGDVGCTAIRPATRAADAAADRPGGRP